MNGQPATKPCERCGRRIEINPARDRNKTIRVCFDCRYSDREYIRLRTANDTKRLVTQGISVSEQGRMGKKNGPDRSVRALQPGPSPTADTDNGRGAFMVLTERPGGC